MSERELVKVKVFGLLKDGRGIHKVLIDSNSVKTLRDVLVKLSQYFNKDLTEMFEKGQVLIFRNHVEEYRLDIDVNKGDEIYITIPAAGG